MRILTTALLAWLATLNPAQADVYVSVDANGSYVLSNVHRPGRHYQRVIAEPGVASVATSRPELVTGKPYAELIAAAARANGLPEALLHAVVHAESRYDANARSGSGAMGLMQLMPETAKELGVTNALDPAANLDGGARYLKRMMKLFDNDVALAVAAYNAGPEAVLSRGRVIPPFAETQRYVPQVLRRYRELRGE